ncbi:MAG: enoyl-CoA hydratase-related protein [Microlunatus sp.]|nr:enoyl-CoA hydratase-related protein [Microlunatus sp.]MDN5771318.1 enoyl-CoA hydratase-related protein [Microlunatus sp.]MDN5803073.1 enoyl-CoA hydratase-related protein [Microlunatus sp.]
MSTAPVLVERLGGVGTVRLNRPENLNALNLATKTALLEALRGVAADPGVRCVVLIGTGRAFSVGHDLREHVRQLADDGPEAVWATVPEHYNPIATVLHTMDKPVVAAVNGVAAGAGASLAFLADLRLVSASAGFNLAFAQIGLSCDTGCSWTLPRLVGPTKAMQLLYTGGTITAEESLRLGIATEVIPDAGFAQRVSDLAGQLAVGPTQAYAAMRQSVAYATHSSLPEALAYEADMMRRTGSTEDHQQAVDAFLAKRPPVFTGQQA